MLLLNKVVYRLIGLDEGISIIQSVQEIIAKEDSNILCFLPELYSKYNHNKYDLTNFLLRLDFDGKGKHYFTFIKEHIEKNEKFANFDISVETRGIELKHKKSGMFLYSSGNTILKISYGDRTYDSSYLEYQEGFNKTMKKQLEELDSDKEDKPKSDWDIFYDKSIDVISEYVENPSFKQRVKLFKVTLDKDKNGFIDYINAVRNMFTSRKVLEEIHKRHMTMIETKDEEREKHKNRLQERCEWIDNEFPFIKSDVLDIIEYLKSLGYTYRKDIY